VGGDHRVEPSSGFRAAALGKLLHEERENLLPVGSQNGVDGTLTGRHGRRQKGRRTGIPEK